MFPLLTGAITGGASLLGSIFSSETSASNTQAQIAAQEQMMQATENYNADQTAAAESWNAGMVANQENYETNMSNTAYQRASDDMQRAGLNPAMMFGGAGAASTPSAAAPAASPASVGTPSVPMSQKTSPLAGLGQAVQAGVSSAVNAETFDKMTQEIANLKVQQAKTAAETITEQARPASVAAQTALTQQSAKGVSLDSDRKQYEMPSSELKGSQAGAILNLPPWLLQGAAQAGFLGQKTDDMISPVINSAGALFKWMPKTVERSRSNAGGGSFDEFYKERTGF